MLHKKSHLTNLLSMGAVCAATLSATATTANTTPPVSAETVFDASFVDEVGGSERINYSGKLRMLSQRIPAAACNLNSGVDAFKMSDVLKAAEVEFTTILDALEFGNGSMGIIGPETNRKGLMALKSVRDVWLPMEEETLRLLADGQTDEAEMFIAEQNMPLLDAAKLLVSQLSGQYSDPTALVQADALRIDIAGRQRMLTQKVSKEACHILAGIDAEDAKLALPRTIQMFEVSLQALQFGMPEAGIKASDDPLINEGLDLVSQNWSTVRPMLQSIEDGGTLDLNARADLFHGLNTTMVNMNKVVGLYSNASKLGL